MRRVLLAMVFMAAFCAVAVAQKINVTGKVTDSSGASISGASVRVKGTKTGVSADNAGAFSLQVDPGTKLVFSAAGFKETELTASEAMTVVLGGSSANLTEVVVTALGVKRSKNSLTYAAQQVSGDEVSKSRGSNFVSALSGKVSGVEIRQGNGLGSSTNVVVRGSKSLTQSNQALFVVDGVPVDNSTTNSANQVTGRGGYDYGNAAADINPDDIESMNVLKGAAATALYGSRAANGVVMITTKKGRKGLGITVNSGVTVGTIDKSTYTKYQKEYGAGYGDGYSKTADGSPDTRFWWKPNPWGTGNILVVPTTEDASYGAKFDPSLMVYQWDAFVPTSPNYGKATPWVGAANDPTAFFENAVSNNNSVVLDGGSDKGNFKLGYTRNEEKGLLPNSKIVKNIINFGASYNITNQLTASAAVNFSKVAGLGRYGTGYNDWNPNQQFRQWWQTNVDLKALKDAYFNTLPGQPRQNMTWNWKSPTSGASGLIPIYSDNPYWTRYENYENDSRFRTFGNVALNYKPAEWLNILGRVSMDTYDEQQEERSAVGSNDPSSYSKYLRTFREVNYDLIANFDKNLTKDLNLKALIGTNIRRTVVSSTYAITNGGLLIPNLYSLNNSVSAPAAPTEVYQPTSVDGYFAGLTLGYKDFATIDATGRRDRSSTLPEDNNAYNYYSVAGGFVFSKLLKDLNWLSYGKIRLNYAEVGNSAPWGSTMDVYSKPTPFGSANLFALPSAKANKELQPERTKSKEIGLEMSFLKSRVGFDITYYDANSINQIFNTPVTTSVGYSSKWVNGGTINNKGIELSLYGSPIRNKNFSWDINVNWTRNRNKVVELYEGGTNVVLGSFQQGITINATKGEAYGTIQGKTWELVDGQKLVNSKGRYVSTGTTTNVIGNVNPDWVGGIYNTFKYKNLSLGFLIDVRQGGDLFSLDLAYGFDSGMYDETVAKNDKGNDSRLPIADGGGVIMPGVTADGKPNTIRVENINGTYGYQYNPNAAFIFDASYVKLRELNFTYSLPASIIRKIAPFKGIDVSLIGRNLWIIHKNLPYADPEENLSAGNVQGYQSGAYPTARTMGVNLKLKF